MATDIPILLFVSDPPVLSSLQFALTLQGFPVLDGSQAPDPTMAACLVIDQACRGDGLNLLAGLRADGCMAPALLLATNPNRALRARAADAGATIIEKPLLGDDLIRALDLILQRDEAA